MTAREDLEHAVRELLRNPGCRGGERRVGDILSAADDYLAAMAAGPVLDAIASGEKIAAYMAEVAGEQLGVATGGRACR